MMQPQSGMPPVVRARCAFILLIFAGFTAFSGLVMMITGWSLDIGPQGIMGIIVFIVALVLMSVGIYLCYSYRREQKSNPQPVQAGPLISGYAPAGANYPMGNVSGPQPGYPPVSTYPTGPQVPGQPQPGMGYPHQGYPGQPGMGYQAQPQPGTGYPPPQPSSGIGYQGYAPDPGFPQPSAPNEPPPGSGLPPSYAAATGEKN